MKISVFHAHIDQVVKETGCSLEECLQYYADRGLEALEIHSSSINEIGREALKGILERTGLQLSGIYMICNFAEDPDLASVRSTLEDARYFGVTNVMIVPGSFYDPARRKEESQQIVETMRAACALGKEYGVSISVEDFGVQNTITSTLPDMLWLLGQVEDLKVTLDTGNFMYSDADLAEAFDSLKDRIVHVHMKDQNFRRPADYTGQKDVSVSGVEFYPSSIGFGDLSLGDTLQKLYNIGYDGHLAIEIFRMPHMEQAITDSIRWIRKTLDNIKKG